MNKLILATFLFILPGCSLLPTRTVNHDVMVTVPCKVTFPQKPVMPLTDSAKVGDDIFVKVKKALSEIELRKGYELQLETAAGSCQ